MREVIEMAKVLIVYYSRSGNTKAMAEAVAEGVREEGLECTVRRVEDTTPDDMKEHEGIILGTPTYFGDAAAEVRKLIDESVKYYGKFEGKVGAAFASCGAHGGGAETAIMSILQAFLIHGMIIQGISVEGAHYGPISVGKPKEADLKECRNLGRRVARLVKKLF